MISGWSVRSLPMAWIYQVAGALLPALLMLAVFPIVSARLNERAFATFAFLFTVVSMLSVLDAGLGRGVTYFASRHLGRGDNAAALRSLIAALVLGTCFALMALIVGLLIYQIWPAPNLAINIDIVVDLFWFMPIFVIGSLLRGFLEAERRFLATNIVQLTYGISVAAMPLVILRWAQNLDMYPWTLGVIRLAFVIVFACLIWAKQRNTRIELLGLSKDIDTMFRYSRWLFSSNLVGMVIIFSDRVMVSLYLQPDLVAAYIVPMEFLLRGQVLIAALCTVLFPNLVRMNTSGIGSLYLHRFTEKAQLLFAGLSLFLVFTIFPFVPAVLSAWMGDAFAAVAAPVVRLGIIGFMLIGCAAIAMAALNARGNTGAPAALHLFELPFYVGALYVVVQFQQVLLIQLVWLSRLVVDLIAMNLMLRRQSHETSEPNGRQKHENGMHLAVAEPLNEFETPHDRVY